MAVQVGIRKQNAAEVITKVVEGPTGPQGPIGFTGPQGPPGIQGPAGSSNSKWYIGSGAPNLGIGIDNNNDLYLDIDTYDAWFRPTTSWELIGNFKGATGPQGPQGLQGIQGIQGETGQQGIQGLKGDTGDTGPQGIQGIPGIKGDTGDTGPQGLQGIQGIQGEMGPQGPAGDDGVDAPTSFETVSKNLKGYPYTLSYSSGVLSAMVYTTESGIITKSFTYSLGILTSITLSGDTPNGIALVKNLVYTNGVLTSVGYS